MDLYREELDGTKLSRYPLITGNRSAGRINIEEQRTKKEDERSKKRRQKKIARGQQDGFSRLEKSIMDVIKEEQAKLGYRKEKIRLYYPLSSLNHFFQVEGDVTGMLEKLNWFRSIQSRDWDRWK